MLVDRVAVRLAFAGTKGKPTQGTMPQENATAVTAESIEVPANGHRGTQLGATKLSLVAPNVPRSQASAQILI